MGERLTAPRCPATVDENTEGWTRASVFACDWDDAKQVRFVDPWEIRVREMRGSDECAASTYSRGRTDACAGGMAVGSYCTSASGDIAVRKK